MFHLPRCQSISLLFTDLSTTLLNHLSNTSLFQESKNQQAGAMLLRCCCGGSRGWWCECAVVLCRNEGRTVI